MATTDPGAAHRGDETTSHLLHPAAEPAMQAALLRNDYGCCNGRQRTYCGVGEHFSRFLRPAQRYRAILL